MKRDETPALGKDARFNLALHVARGRSAIALAVDLIAVGKETVPCRGPALAMSQSIAFDGIQAETLAAEIDKTKRGIGNVR